MTPIDSATCSDFWKEVRALTEIVHTRGAEGLLDLLMEDFATLPGEKRTLVQRQLSTLIGMLPFLKQAKAACVAGPAPVSQKVPYRD